MEQIDSRFIQRLYNYFGDIELAFNATLSDLSQIDGLNIKKAEAIIEAVLFAMGDSVELSKLEHVLELGEAEIREIIASMNKKYKKQDRGIYIAELENSFQLSTKPELYDYLIKVAKAPRKYSLSDTLLETLSIVAYKQPVTRIEVEKIKTKHLNAPA